MGVFSCEESGCEEGSGRRVGGGGASKKSMQKLACPTVKLRKCTPKGKDKGTPKPTETKNTDPTQNRITHRDPTKRGNQPKELNAKEYTESHTLTRYQKKKQKILKTIKKPRSARIFFYYRQRCEAMFRDEFILHVHVRVIIHAGNESLS